ncbi:MAG: hypothetical protein R3B90_22300 [Planctomycetaceae bacterium]
MRQLEDQLERGEVDEEFKRRLGVTDDDLRQFIQRLEDRLATEGQGNDPESIARQRQLEETLKGIQYDSQGGRRDAGEGPRQSTREPAASAAKPLRSIANWNAYRERVNKGR